MGAGSASWSGWGTGSGSGASVTTAAGVGAAAGATSTSDGALADDSSGSPTARRRGSVIAEWAEKILAQPWKEAFVFLKHDEGDAPSVAKRLIGRLNQAP